ncbi:MAG TPA: sigma-70 family RNA polymerase sigma factor [Solirubrobacteraceae bacterium]
MGLIRTGDEVAFGVLYQRHHSAALAVSLRICHERSLAEDAVQEAFIALWRRAHLYDPCRGHLRSWMLAIVHNAAIDVLRRGMKGAGGMESDEQIEQLLQVPDEAELETGKKEREKELRSALDALPGEQSSVIELAYFGGYSLVEIASMLSTPLGTVKGRMRLGIEKLRAAMVGDEALV